MSKLKVSREFIFKAYLVNFNEGKEVLKLIKKSECHYYVEKECLDFINMNYNNLTVFNKDKDYLKIIKYYDSDISDKEPELIELIKFSEGKIYIK